MKDVNVTSKSMPAKSLISKKQASQTGQTTGQTNCIIGLFGCQQSVDASDVSNLVSQMKPALQRQIMQDLRNQIAVAGGTQVGSISFHDVSSTPDPMVGAVSNTVTVTLVEQRNVDYIVKKNTQNLTQQLLVKQTNKHY